MSVRLRLRAAIFAGRRRELIENRWLPVFPVDGGNGLLEFFVARASDRLSPHKKTIKNAKGEGRLCERLKNRER